MKSLILFIFILTVCSASVIIPKASTGMGFRRNIPELPGRTNRIEPPISRQARSTRFEGRLLRGPPKTVKGSGKITRRGLN
uniref:Uncharacterized protein n=1 Tax=Caenorhabditis tropicalis TaxID=1561998 RepID=A0A1I7T6F5_9PELO